ncbi:hypothetical protein [Streptomyces sp. GbtcB6]|uniref:hypothetical protein n=1 Tax=Streptomyces sp. GbtcB6 TaxID=2824751 RepID=UPI001C2FE1E0|nr:hypothetical protein [Streptomyces sp. GbtcB6]
MDVPTEIPPPPPAEIVYSGEYSTNPLDNVSFRQMCAKLPSVLQRIARMAWKLDGAAIWLELRLRLHNAGRRTDALVSVGAALLAALALAALDLKEGRRTNHPELVLFASWGELQDYAAYDPAGGDLQPCSAVSTVWSAIQSVTYVHQ